jgi:uncharacterized protein (UPF0332 family)
MSSEDVAVLVRLRLRQAEGVLRDARSLIDGSGTRESIVNRVYYAMFYAALAALQSISRAPRKHKGAISLFYTEFVVKGIFTKEMSTDLHRVFELRQDIDYRTVEPPAHEQVDVEVLYSKAAVFVRAVRDHLLSGMSGSQ